MGEIINESTPFLGIEEYLEDLQKVNENIITYNENIEKIDEIQKKLLKGIGWNQEARKHLSDDLDTLVKSNKTIEKEVKTKIKEGCSHNFSSEEEECRKQEGLVILSNSLLDYLTKYKNMNIQFKEKSKRKLVNAIQIIGGQNLTDDDIEHAVDNDDIDSILPTGIVMDSEQNNEQRREAKERYEEFKKLEEDILEQTDLYNDIMKVIEPTREIYEVEKSQIESKIPTCDESHGEPIDFLGIARNLYEMAQTKKRILAMIAAALFLLLLIIIIAASTSGTEPELESEPEQEPEIQPCDPSVDPDCVG